MQGALCSIAPLCSVRITWHARLFAAQATMLGRILVYAAVTCSIIDRADDLP